MSHWAQKTVTLKARARGCHLVTEELTQGLKIELSEIEIGVVHFFSTPAFTEHTSASLTINENCDPNVRADLETVLNRLVPESQTYAHDDEGPDDMPDGHLGLGIWQGIYLNEHRNNGGARRVVVTLNGLKKNDLTKK